jgi:hypothetical protein
MSVLGLFLAIVTFCLNGTGTVVLAHPFKALATFPVCFSVLSCWTNRAPSTPSSSDLLYSCNRFQGTSIALMALRVCMSTFPLSALILVCSPKTIPSVRESRYRCVQLFFSCCQLGYFSIQSTSGVPGGVGVQPPPPPRNSKVLTKLSRIPSSVENTSVTT